PLYSREQELLTKHWIEWTKSISGAGYCLNLYDGKPFSPPNRAILYHRGFISELTCTATDFLAHADAILREHPVRRVRLTTMPDRFKPSPNRDHRAMNLAWLKSLFPTIEFELPERYVGIDLASPEGDHTVVHVDPFFL